MLVTFSTKSYADITMFGDIAIHLLKLMGHSGTVPGAILADDVPEALQQLQSGVEAGGEPVKSDEDEKDEEDTVSINVRAVPLIELLQAAKEGHSDVMWEGN